MLISISTQIKLVFYAITSGVITGLLFDIYRVIRGFENPNKVITFIQDALFWVLAAILVFLFLLTTRYIYIGIYLYMYIALGIYLYSRLMSRRFVSVQTKVMKGSGKAFRITRNIMVYPFELIVHKLKVKNK